LIIQRKVSIFSEFLDPPSKRLQEKDKVNVNTRKLVNKFIRRVGQNKTTYNFQVVSKMWLGLNHASLFIPPNATLLLCFPQHPIVSLEILLLILNLRLCEMHVLVSRVEYPNHHIPGFAAPPILASIIRIVVLVK
jgi:hypothetical protein